MLIGYARVSTPDQDLTLQLNALKSCGCENVFTDTASGMKTDREGMNKALLVAREGDTLVVWKLDRLGRSMKGLQDLLDLLKARKINLKSLTDGIDTGTPAGRFFFNVMASLAEMERDLMRERTNAGLEAARLAGRLGGRPSAMTKSKHKAAIVLLDAGKPAKEVAETLGIKISTFYRHFPAGRE